MNQASASMQLPLLFPDSRHALVWQQDRAVSRAEFAAAARALAPRLPAAAHVVNLCAGRLHFMLALAAAALRGQTTLLPPNQTAAALAQLKAQYPHQAVLDDAVVSQWLGTVTLNATTIEPLLVAADVPLLTLFTSGSTGVPQAQLKTWRSLSATAALDAQRFTPAPVNLVATVP